MGTVFTDEQKKAIDTRNCDIIVSASAGSGKTAVLVERIIKIITENQTPVDIDNLLVVTFTSAAASEMRERILKALAKAVEEGADEHVSRQIALINHADITTIHSFCMKTVRENYTKLNIDPDFRIADENECEIIKGTVLDELFEEKYGSENNEGFLKLVETFGQSLSDSGLKDIVLTVHSFIQSMPFPEKFLDGACQKYDFDSQSDFGETFWGEYIKKRCAFEADECLKYIDKALNLAYNGGPASYAKALSADLENISKIKEYAENDFEKLSQYISALSFGPIGRAGKNDDKALAETIKNLRETVKKSIGELKEKFFFTSLESEIKTVLKTGSVINELCILVKDFSQKYAEAKRERNIADFNDLEHFALKILIEEKNGEFVPSPEALSLQKKYYEIMTDEYQDSNPVQEMILYALSGKGQKANNRFMVGDVKQSIYRFRQAEPGIFLEKYNSYKESGSQIKIDLFQNFRSRKEVLYATNFIFSQIMTKEAGEMDYTEKSYLYPGAKYPENSDMAVEVDIIEKNSETDDEELDDISSAQAEMSFVSKKIRELIDSGFEVCDIKSETSRPVRYSDIAIITRKIKNWGQAARDALDEQMIPYYMDNAEKYFERKEISDVLSLLSVIDNSKQDIPLAASLKLPYYGVTDDELLKIRMESQSLDFYDAVKEYASNGSDEGLKEKIQKFFGDIEKWKKEAPFETVGDIIWDIYNVTGHYDYVGALKGGALKQANLIMLIEKAHELEKNNFKGLFNFIRYIQRLQSTGSDFGGAKITGDKAEVVRIMTVHKSKGLEFPVVFLCGTGGSFNKNDLTSKVLLHTKAGIVCDYTDLEKRAEYPALSKNIVSDMLKHESAAEEMRVLYVAMTRAKEKLFITGTVKSISQKCALWSISALNSERKLPYYSVVKASSFLDWIGSCLVRHRCGAVLGDFCSDAGNTDLFNDKSVWKINVIPKNKAVEKYDILLSDLEEEKETLKIDVENICGINAAKEKFPANLYVSEVKRIMESMESDYKDSKLYNLNRFEKPEFLSQTEDVTPSRKGTAVHSVLENMDFSLNYTKDDIKSVVSTLVSKGIISDKEGESVNINSIYGFTQSDLYKRILKSDLVYKEKPFAMELTPYEIFEDEKYAENTEKILVHGMIDCIFKEKDKFVLVDYKTDYVPRGKEEDLKHKYSVQLRLYKLAAQRALNCEINDVYIFSLYALKEIKI